jgi:hypothetical protein
MENLDSDYEASDELAYGPAGSREFCGASTSQTLTPAHSGPSAAKRG